jgi:hypothetical protein
MDAAIIFPVFRKLRQRDVYYCINSTSQFSELSKMGVYYSILEITAVQYPEKVRIHEMILGELPYEIITEAEFERVKSDWSNNLKKFEL